MWVTDKQVGYLCIITAIAAAIAGFVYGRGVQGTVFAVSLIFFGYALIRDVNREEQDERDATSPPTDM